MRINDIKTFFEENVQKNELKKLSFDNDNSVSLVNSSFQSFDFDMVNSKIKTCDTILFEKDKIIFVEFKRGKIKDIDFRLKATESIISFYNFIFESGFKENLCFPNVIFQIYIVYDRNNSSPTRTQAIVSSGRKIEKEYKHFFSKYVVIDNDKFQNRFRL